MSKTFDKEEFKERVKENVKTLYRKTIKEATQQQLFQAVSYAVKDDIINNWLATQKQYEIDDPKTVYYMSMEFLMGRALGNNLINLCAYKEVKEALDEMAALAVWQHASSIHLQRLDIPHTAAVSVTVTVCLNRKSRMVIR